MGGSFPRRARNERDVTHASSADHPLGNDDELDRDDAIDEVASAVAALAQPRLLVFDCDGVLAPLVDHADDSVLLDDVGELLAAIASQRDTCVAVLSGRSLAGLEQFEFDPSIVVAGSYGAERRGHGELALTSDEAELLTRLGDIAIAAAATAGAGAWVEHNPASVVVHVRQAEPRRGAAALDDARRRADAIDGAEVHDGSNVVELMARASDKGAGLDRLRADTSAAGVLYVGDDVPDEAAFERADVSVKVGAGTTGAQFRLADPTEVRELLARTATLGPHAEAGDTPSTAHRSP